MDDLKISHMDSKVVDDFVGWVQETYGSIGKVKVNRGKVHNYLGMKLNYTKPGQVSIDMKAYVWAMVAAFPLNGLKGKVASPWNENLFKVHPQSPELKQEQAEFFHTIVVQ